MKTKCTGKHRIEDYPISSEAEKKEFLSKHMENLKAKNNRVSSRNVVTHSDKYNIDVEIGGVDAKARDDTGADVTIIQMSLLKRVKAKTPPVELKKFSSPM